jgi:hypothetical protein
MASAKTRPDQHAHAHRLPQVRSLASTSATPAGDDDDPSSRLTEVLDRSVPICCRARRLAYRQWD